MPRPISLRDHIERTLALIADRQAQLRYQQDVPCIDVATELFLQWEDWYRPKSESFAQIFDRDEASTLQTFHEVFETVRNNFPQGLPPIAKFVQTTAWKRYSSAARLALDVLRSRASKAA